MYSNNIVNFQESATILNACTKKSGSFLKALCIIAASTKCHSDELILPNRYITALKSLSSNHNIVISPSGKGGGIVIMDSTVYNQKLMVITTVMNKYPYKQLQIILMTFTNPTENLSPIKINLGLH